MTNQKRGNKKAMAAWIWILIILVIIAVGIGAYFLFSGGSESSSIIGGSFIPQPPALPN